MAVNWDDILPQVEANVNTPQSFSTKSARSRLIDSLGLEVPDYTALESKLPTPVSRMPKVIDYTIIPKDKGPEAPAIFDVPILGPIISAIDKPAAAIRSTIKEIGDIFVDDQNFSFSEWWDQTNRHMMMGEVMRDWNIAPDDPLEAMVTGLFFDIAFDPLTYLAGAGLISRTVKADDVAMALRQQSVAQRNLKNIAKATELEKAAEAVSRSGSILAAGAALDDVGIAAGLRFTIPATGRIGKTIIEKPLRALNPRIGEFLDMRRIGQLSQDLLPRSGPLSQLDEVIDLSDELIQSQIFNRMQDIRKAKVTDDLISGVDTAARQAMRMPVEAFAIPFSKGTILGKVTGKLGMAWKGALASKHISTLADNLSTKAGFRPKFSADPELQQMGQITHNGSLYAAVAASTFESNAVGSFSKLLREAQRNDIDFAVVWNLPVQTYMPDGSINPALTNVDPRFASEAWSDFHNKIFNKTDGFWTEVGNGFNNGLPYKGVDHPLNMLEVDFYTHHALTDEGFKKLKGMAPEDPLSAAQQSGVTGLRGSSLMARTFQSPSEMAAKIAADYAGFQRLNDGKEWRRLIRAMGLPRDVRQDEFIREFIDYANYNPVTIDVPTNIGGRKSVTTIHNRVGGQNVMDPDKFAIDNPDLGALDILSQAKELNKKVYGVSTDKEYIDLFSKDPQLVFTRYITSQSKSLRSQYMLDFLQEAGLIVRTRNNELLRDNFDEFVSRLSFLRSGDGQLLDTIWAGTKGRKAKTAKKYWGLERRKEVVDNVSRQLADFENAVEWITNLRQTGDADFLSQFGGTLSQSSIRTARDLVADLSTVDAMIDDLNMAINAIYRGSMDGISEKAKALLKGEELVEEFRATSTKKAYKKTREDLLLETTQGVPQKAKISVKRPATAKPSTQELADGFNNLAEVNKVYEEAGQVISDLYGLKSRLDAIIKSIQEQVALVGVTKPTTSGKIKSLWGVDDGFINRRQPADLPRPKTMKDIEATNVSDIIASAEKGGFSPEAFGPTPSDYLNIFTKRIENKVSEVQGALDAMQVNLAKNVVGTHPTTSVASLMELMNDLVTPELLTMNKVISNIDNGTLKFIRDGLENLRGAGKSALAASRDPNNLFDLPAPITEEMIRFINAALRGGSPTKQTYPRNLPLDILEQIALKLKGEGAGAVRQWVKSVKELEELGTKLDDVMKTNLTPSLSMSRNVRDELLTKIARQEESLGRAFLLELENQIAKGRGSKINRETADQLNDWVNGLERIRTDATVKLNDFEATWSQRLETIGGRLADEKESLRLTQEKLLEQWRLIDEEVSRYNNYLSSPVLKDRTRASSTMEEGLAALKDRRSAMGFATAWNEAASEFVTRFTPFPSTKGVESNISNYTINNLRGFSLTDNYTKEQAEAMQSMFQAAAKTFDMESMGDFARKYLTLVNWWKAMAISTTGFIMRNTAGGFWVNNQIAGVPLSTHTRVLGIRDLARKAAGDTGDELLGLSKLIQDGKNVALPKRYRLGEGAWNISVDELKLFREWYETGVATSGQVSQEIRSAISDPFNARRGLQVSGATAKPWKAEFYPAALIRSYNQDAEFMLRGALAHHRMTSGKSVAEAFADVEKYHFNYSDLTSFERKVKMAVPFWTWQKNVVPILLESMGKNPKAWGRLQQVKGELELQSDAEGIVPEYFAENMGMRTPWSWNNNRVYVLPDLPFRDASRWLKEMEQPQNFWKSPVRAVAESSLPWMKLPIELWAGKQTFADIPITGRYQQAPSWANIPVLKEALETVGWLKTNAKGELKMRDNHIYMLDQFNPLFGRARRLIPNEEGKQERWFTTFINTFFGAGLRMNTPRAQRGQMIKDQVEISKTFRDMVDLESREL
jgi:hypothetical protein